MILLCIIAVVVIALSVFTFNKLAAYCKKQVSGFHPVAARCNLCHTEVARKQNGMGEWVCKNC